MLSRVPPPVLLLRLSFPPETGSPGRWAWLLALQTLPRRRGRFSSGGSDRSSGRAQSNPEPTAWPMVLTLWPGVGRVPNGSCVGSEGQLCRGKHAPVSEEDILDKQIPQVPTLVSPTRSSQTVPSLGAKATSNCPLHPQWPSWGWHGAVSKRFPQKVFRGKRRCQSRGRHSLVGEAAGWGVASTRGNSTVAETGAVRTRWQGVKTGHPWKLPDGLGSQFRVTGRKTGHCLEDGSIPARGGRPGGEHSELQISSRGSEGPSPDLHTGALSRRSPESTGSLRSREQGTKA